MKTIYFFVLGLILTLHGCALLPTQLGLAKNQKVSHKQKELSDHKIKKLKYKTEKSNSKLKDRITLVDFKLFDKDQHKSKKHHKKKITSPATGKVSTAFFASGIDLVDIPRQGMALMPFLIEHEMDRAVVTTQAMIRKGTIEERNRNITSILDLHPDVIVLQQGPVTTVFPRAMLGFSQIANVVVVPNNTVSTLDSDENGLTHFNDDTKFDPLLSNELLGDVQRYSLTGFADKSGTMETDQGKAHVDTVTKEFSKKFPDNSPAVVVVYRNYQGQFCRIIMPNPAYGALKSPEEDGSVEQIKWNYLFSAFTRMGIRDGDVIEFTTLDLMNLTSPF